MPWRSLALVAALCGALFSAVPAAGRGVPDSFADLSAKLLPTVVNIATTQTLRTRRHPAQTDIQPGSPLDELLKKFMGPGHNRPRHITSVGSGFIIDPSGYIVTNNHVVEGAEQIMVTLNDGTSLPAKLVGRDEKTDLALVKIKPKHRLPAAHFGNSDKARIGDWVIAIGNPFGLGSTVTAGIVSARNRNIDAGPYDEFIQTDAPINRGNSGGPLFDMNGKVVGVNSAIYSPTGGSVGIGFSIPSNLAKAVIAQLRRYGTVRRGYVGVNIQPVTADLAEGMGLHGTAGALVSDVKAGGPAARAGIRRGDIIMKFDGKPVPDPRTLSRLAADARIGKTVPIEVVRAKHRITVHLKVQRLKEPSAHRPARRPPPAKRHKSSALGLSLSPLNGATRTEYRVPGYVHGVVVTDVEPDSPAEENNFRTGDVIVAVRNQPVQTPQDVLRRMAADLKSGRKVEVLLVSRDGSTTYVAVRL